MLAADLLLTFLQPYHTPTSDKETHAYEDYLKMKNVTYKKIIVPIELFLSEVVTTLTNYEKCMQMYLTVVLV